MNSCKEIGGYFALDFFHSQPNNWNGIMLNSGRNSLRYIIRAHNIKELLVPYYTCPVVWKAIEHEHVKPIFYRINSDLEIDLPYLPENNFILVNNYFGVKGKYIRELAKQYSNLIVDDAQSFYAPKVGLAHFKSPRKFFGLPDGGIALCQQTSSQKLPQSTSWSRCSHLLMRADIGAEAGYEDFKKNEASLDNLPIEKMSNLTQQMLASTDFATAKQRRITNFHILHEALKHKNWLSIDIDNTDVPMFYPFLCKNRTLKQKLIDNKIFVATYWPHIEEYCPKNSYELELQSNLLALPIDQRYDELDMQRILEVIDGN